MMTWKIKRENIEEILGDSSLSKEEIPFILKSLPWTLGIFYLTVRVANIIDCFIGTQTADPYSEIRFAVVFLAGALFEIIVSFPKALINLRGMFLFIGSMCSIMDGSCYYYPEDFALMPSCMPIFFGMVAATFLYCHSWISIAIAYFLAYGICIVFYVLFFQINVVALVFMVITGGVLIYVGAGSLYSLNNFLSFLLRKIKQSEIKIAGTMNQLYNLPIGIFIYNEGRVADWNKTLAKMAGVRKEAYSIPGFNYEEEFNSSFSEFIEDLHRIPDGTRFSTDLLCLSQVFRDKKTQSYKIHRGLTTTKFNIKCIPFTVGSYTQCLFVLTNITAVQKIKKMQKNAEFNKRVIASIIHDLRTPLNGILGITESLKETFRSSSREMEIDQLDIIQNTGRMMLYLIGDILDIVQSKAGQILPHASYFNPQEVVVEVSNIVMHNYLQKGVELSTTSGFDVPTTVYTDSLRYKQILLNLLGNALKFTPSSGHVKINIRYDEPDMLVTQVQDNGIGIKTDFLPKLFQLFGKIKHNTELNPTGVGLGLHICKTLSHLLGGGVFVESQESRGSRFTFFIKCNLEDPRECIVSDFEELIKIKYPLRFNEEYLPSKITNNSPRKKISSPESGKYCCAPLLLVDDNPTNLTVLQTYLKGTNIFSDIAYNGKEAVKKVKERKSRSCCGRYKLIMMDLLMPEMNGIEAALHINKLGETNQISLTPILALSSTQLSPEGEADLIKKGFKGHLSKPVSKSTFLSTIKKYL